MRRLLNVLLPVVVAVVAASVSAPATASPAETAIICPAVRAITPCCPIPVSAVIVPCCAAVGSGQPICCHGVATQIEPICCLTPAICPVPLTIAANPDPATVAQRVVISGTGSPATQITLHQELPGHAVFTQVATTTTNRVGAYAFVPGSVQTDRQWYVTAGSQQSRTIVEDVRALVTLTVSGRGRAVHLRGHVTPSHPGGLVVLEQRHDGRWRVIARIRLDNRSSYAIADTFAHHGVIHLRALLPGDKWNLRSLSRVITLTT